MATLYETLEVSEGCSKETLSAAYRSLGKRFHPDVNSTKTAHNRMSEITEAYSILSDDAKRREYDAQLKEHRDKPRYGRPDAEWQARAAGQGQAYAAPQEVNPADIALQLFETFALPSLPGSFTAAYPLARNDIRTMMVNGLEKLVRL